MKYILYALVVNIALTAAVSDDHNSTVRDVRVTVSDHAPVDKHESHNEVNTPANILSKAAIKPTESQNETRIDDESLKVIKTQTKDETLFTEDAKTPVKEDEILPLTDVRTPLKDVQKVPLTEDVRPIKEDVENESSAEDEKLPLKEAVKSFNVKESQDAYETADGEDREGLKTLVVDLKVPFREDGTVRNKTESQAEISQKMNLDSKYSSPNPPATPSLSPLSQAARVAGCDEAVLTQEQEFTCVRGDTTVIVQASEGQYASVECQEGSNLPCSSFPYLPVGDNATLVSLSLAGCSALPGACVLRGLQAAGVGTLRLRNVEGGAVGELEGMVEGLEGMKMLVVEERAPRNVSTPVPWRVLSRVRSVRDWRVKRANLTLPPGGPEASNVSSSLRSLELSRCGIPGVPARALAGLRALTTLGLWGNQIQAIEKDAFQELPSLRVLSLSQNKLAVLAPSMFAGAPNLRQLSLFHNPLREIQTDALSGLPLLDKLEIFDLPSRLVISRGALRLPSLGGLSVRRVGGLALSGQAFDDMRLTSLVLQKTNITSLPAEILNSQSSLQLLDLSRNALEALPDDLLQTQSALQRLDLSYNRLRTLPETLLEAASALEELNLDDNLLIELTGKLFTRLTRLTRLSINNNRLTSLSFPPLPSLSHLSLRHNSLSLSPPGYRSLQPHSSLRALGSLVELDVGGNRVENVFGDWRYVMLKLEVLNLTQNRFDLIMDTELSFLQANITVDLRRNNVSRVLYTSPLPPLDTPSTTPALVLLQQNPLHCDCGLYRVGLNKQTHIQTDPLLCDIPTPGPICEISTPICPRNCSCEDAPAINAMILTCTVAPSVENYPKPWDYFLNRTLLRLEGMKGVNGNLSIPEYVKELNLSHLSLKTVPHIPKSVVFVDLRNNSLEIPPLALLKNNLTMKLSGNKFICECEAADVIATLQQYKKKVIDYFDLVCADGSMVWKQTPTVCDASNWVIWVAITIIISLGAIVSLLIALRKWKYDIKLKTLQLPEEEKIYDIFLSFCHEDEEFVAKELLPNLDRDYTVCIPYRDWIVGESICSQLAHSVATAHVTLVVVSDSYAEGGWAGVELRAAERAGIAVLRGGGEHLLAGAIAVKWGEKHFWRELRKVLPPVSKKIVK